MKRTEDYYAKLAKSKGYPARSVYKLMEIQEKYKVLRKGIKVLDLGAAPGSWSQFVLEYLAGSGLVVGVDLKPIECKPQLASHYRPLQGSFNNEEILKQIKEWGPYHVIISDAAPSTSGDGFIDSHRSIEIGQRVIEIARENLKPGGNLVIKIFQGGEEKEILDILKTLFEKVKPFKPKASRDESVEVFHLGLNFMQGKQK